MIRSKTPGATSSYGVVTYSIGYQGPKYRVGSGGKLIRKGRSSSGGKSTPATKKPAGITATNWSRILYGSGGKQSLTISNGSEYEYDLEMRKQQPTLGSGTLAG